MKVSVQEGIPVRIGAGILGVLSLTLGLSLVSPAAADTGPPEVDPSSTRVLLSLPERPAADGSTLDLPEGEGLTWRVDLWQVDPGSTDRTRILHTEVLGILLPGSAQPLPPGVLRRAESAPDGTLLELVLHGARDFIVHVPVVA